MNYRHLYHAGCFADVFKHTLLISLINTLQVKDKPFCYIDTHSGTGMYDLTSEEALKTKEFEAGIERLWQQRDKLTNPIAKKYLELIAQCQNNGPHLYPGSPWFARQLLRPNDRSILCELHPEEYDKLKQLFHYDKQIAIHHRNGYEALKALLPPKEHRGLALIDPPFEKTTEFEDIFEHLNNADKRWPQGIYAIWYPLTDLKKANIFKNKLLQLSFKNILEIEWLLYPNDSPTGLKACGMILINPPWQIEAEIKSLLEEVNRLLAVYPESHYTIKWLKEEM